jgi:hypothetical protein
MRFILYPILFLFIGNAYADDIKDEKYLKAEASLKELRAKKAYAILYKKSSKVVKAFPKKAYAYYCMAESAFQLQEDLKFKKKNKKPLELIRKNLTEAKKYDGEGKTGEEFLSLMKGYQIRLYEEGLKLQKNGFTKGDLHFNIIFKLFDNSNKTYASLYNGNVDLPDSNYNYKEYNHPRYRICNTAKKATYMNDKEKQMLYLLNLIRMDPATFNKTFVLSIKRMKEYDESDQYFGSLIKDLSTASPCKELLFPHDRLYKAAEFHANDMGKKGLTGHESSDGTGPFKRIERFVISYGGMAENCQYGPDEPLEVVMQLMIDQGVPSLGHRKSIMNCSYGQIGIAQRSHSVYGSNTVMDFMN